MTDQMQAQQQAQTAPVVIFTDFICPYSYIAQEQIDQLMQDYDVQPLWRPHWLHPEVPPEGKPSGGDPERREGTLAWLKEMAPEMAARIRYPDKLQFSFFAFEAMEFAQDHGLAMPFKTAVFDALWVEGADIARVSTLQQCADKAGLDGEELGRALHDRAYVKRTLDAVVKARELGITATPTTILGKTKIIGWHYYEAMQTVLEQQGIFPKSAERAEASG